MSIQLRTNKTAEISKRGDFFGVISPAMVYNFLKNHADLSKVTSEYAVPVALPGSEKFFEDFFNNKMANGYFVQTARPENGEIVDAGVVTSNAASPTVYVVTALSNFGEYSENKFISSGKTGDRSISNKKLGLTVDVTIDDIFQFGLSMKPQQKEDILKLAVKQHYSDILPAREIKELPIAQYQLK